jgi:hypothetical protein
VRRSRSEGALEQHDGFANIIMTGAHAISGYGAKSRRWWSTLDGHWASGSESKDSKPKAGGLTPDPECRILLCLQSLDVVDQIRNPLLHLSLMPLAYA